MDKNNIRVFVEEHYPDCSKQEKDILYVLYDVEEGLSDGYHFYCGYDEQGEECTYLLQVARRLVEVVTEQPVPEAE